MLSPRENEKVRQNQHNHYHDYHDDQHEKADERRRWLSAPLCDLIGGLMIAIAYLEDGIAQRIGMCQT